MFKAGIAALSLVLFASCVAASEISSSTLAELAPTGKLRAGINIGNVVLTSRDPVSGEWRGIPFDIARELGRCLGVPVEIVPFNSAGKLAEGAKAGAWDIAFLGIEPERAENISFTAPYAEIAAGYLVPANSPLRNSADVDREGVRIAISAKSAYELVLNRTLKHARLEAVPGVDGMPGIEGAYDKFISEKLDVLAGLKPVLAAYADRLPGSRILDGEISTVEQAIGTLKGREAGVKFLRQFVEDIKASGLIAKTLEKSGARGISVAPAALR